MNPTTKIVDALAEIVRENHALESVVAEFLSHETRDAAIAAIATSGDDDAARAVRRIAASMRKEVA